MLYVQEAGRFADYAFARLDAGTFANPFLREVLEMELGTLILGRTPAWEKPSGLAAPERPRLHPHCRLVTFQHDPDAVMQALDAGRPLDGLAEEERYLLLSSAGGGRVNLRQVPVEQGRVLAMCDRRDRRDGRDGRRSAGEVAAEVLEAVVAEGWVV
jgi:hypothetical protein